ncbi:flavin reductase family protein [Caballeronia ptereochthonis]|uniref:Flavin reductase domain-containing protein n=1 Tax=Caballeronia ptereochthonis TaxID=1777144 RepID=A0A158C654_9BURK|nr:flavin reductase family protein [Caballeronia ptereochthonis]SAK77782.1 flavin reductase domain-containing protein [Caballeronia ptereochthonis]
MQQAIEMEVPDMTRAFRNAMSLFAAGVTAITTMRDGKPAGLIATSVCSLSSDPPSIIVCVSKGASAHDAIVAHGKFAVNLLSVDQCDVVDRFREAKGHERFEAGQWTTLRTGAPVLADASVVLDCTLGQRHDGFTHSIFIGVIEQISCRRNVDSSCLLWHARGFARSVPLCV